MSSLPELFANNAAWANRMSSADPDFFPHLQARQAPRYLWIGCSDSRVCPNLLLGLGPGEIFVHRNIANLVPPDDPNSMSVLRYAVEVLQVEHVIVAGHAGCGGVQAVCQGAPLSPPLDLWLRPLADLRRRHLPTLAALTPPAAETRLCELNVLEQTRHAAESSIVREAWQRGQPLTVHAWIYGLADGRLRDLGFLVSNPEL